MDGLLVDHAASEARIEYRDRSLAIMYIGTMGRKDVHKPQLHWLVCPFLCFVAERKTSLVLNQKFNADPCHRA